MDNFFHSVTFIGAGNVATHLAVSLKNEGVEIHAISSKNNFTARELANDVGAKVINKFDRIPLHSLVIVCVNDESIESVLLEIPESNCVVYTSGNVELNSMPKRENLGVFYPLQTFTKNRELDISEVPFLIESNNQNFGKEIFELGTTISNHVIYANSAERKKIHLGAVFINNFTNHMVYLSKQYLDAQEVNWGLLKPLLKETTEKLLTIEPFEAQTGPARRNDIQTIESHSKQLEGISKAIYDLVSQSILETYKSDQK